MLNIDSLAKARRAEAGESPLRSIFILMITTLFFIELIAFQIWYVTSGQVEHKDPAAYVRNLLRHKRAYRITGAALLVFTLVAFVAKLGWMSGLCAGIAGLMAIGNLVVLTYPFRYLNEKSVVALFALFLVLELFI